MIPDWFLLRILIALGVMLALAFLFLMGHGVWLVSGRRYTHERLARGRAAVSGLVTTGYLKPTDREILRSLPEYIQIRLILELSRTFGGSVREELKDVATEAGIVRRAEATLRSRYWWRRLRAVRILGGLGISDEQILRHLHDPHPAVRAQVAEWAADNPSPMILSALLEMLASADTLYRFTLQDSLLRAGQAAVAPLAKFLSSHGGPQTIPALEVAAVLAHPDLATPALGLTRDPLPLVRARAAEVLGTVGGAEGTDVLRGLLTDPDARVRASAAGALSRLRFWPAAPALAPLLRDPAWDVRRAAGLALRNLGGPGLLLLRRYRTDEDRFASDMAVQILDLPTGREGS